jgi:acetylornithine deacetylase/succinyl-diaminopimelate desuccinylase-like protein
MNTDAQPRAALPKTLPFFVILLTFRHVLLGIEGFVWCCPSVHGCLASLVFAFFCDTFSFSPRRAMDKAKTLSTTETGFATAIPALEEYIRIPNQSPSFDAEIHTNGLQEKAVALIVHWVLEQKVVGLTHRVVHEKGRTPVLLFEVPAHNCKLPESVLMYGHLDKQPPMTASWAPGMGPHTPVIRNGRLYGRGGADDGYSAFAAITAVKALQAQGASHPRIVILIEAAEESGSPDLDYYLAQLETAIGNVGLIVCLDSGCANYEQLWITTSLRGVVGATVRVDVLQHGVHSGAASGIVPSSFRCIRAILDQLEETATGRVLVPELHVEIPPHRVDEARRCAGILGDTVFSEFPWVEGVKPVAPEIHEALLNKTWRPTMCVVGADGAHKTVVSFLRSHVCPGIPALKDGGNVLRAQTTLKLSFRLPPTCDSEKAKKALAKAIASARVPCDGKITVLEVEGAAGWDAPASPPWLSASIEKVCVLMRLVVFSLTHAVPGEPGLLGQAGRVHGRGRQYSLHGSAGAQVSARELHYYRRAGPGLQRARPGRVPGHCVRQEHHRHGCARGGRPGQAGHAVKGCFAGFIFSCRRRTWLGMRCTAGRPSWRWC